MPEMLRQVSAMLLVKHWSTARREFIGKTISKLDVESTDTKGKECNRSSRPSTDQAGPVARQRLAVEDVSRYHHEQQETQSSPEKHGKIR